MAGGVVVSGVPAQLESIFSGVQERFVAELKGGRAAFGHPGTKGEVSEKEWIQLLNTHLPERYQVDKAFVIDCEGNISEQIDIVVYDRHFTPVLYFQNNERLIPAESIYAVFEVKQDLSTEHVAYASQKVGSVRGLKRTSAPIYHAGGTYPARGLPRILGGLLTYESSFSPPISVAAVNAVQATAHAGQLDLVCVANKAVIDWDGAKLTTYERHPIASFYMLLINRLQKLGSVPAIDYDKYLKHLM